MGGYGCGGRGGSCKSGDPVQASEFNEYKQAGCGTPYKAIEEANAIARAEIIQPDEPLTVGHATDGAELVSVSAKDLRNLQVDKETGRRLFWCGREVVLK